MLPDSEKRSALDKAIAPLFEALLTLNETKQVRGIGWIVMTLIVAGYPDYARRLWPSKTTSSGNRLLRRRLPNRRRFPVSHKRARQTAVRPSKLKSAVRRPVDPRLGVLVIDLVPSTAATPSGLAKTLDKEWFRSHPHRSHRIRPAVAGEMPGANAETYIVVRQLAPGVRMRVFFTPVGPFPEREAPEHIAHAMFDLIRSAPGRMLSHQELFQASRAYEIAPDPADPSHDRPRYRH
jgi:hypothetical protein